MTKYWILVLAINAVAAIALYVNKYTKYNCRIVPELLVLLVLCLVAVGGVVEFLG